MRESGDYKHTVFVLTSFIGFHRWRDAPDSVEFLREWHRHEFHVTVCKEVNHDNRAIEFITLKREVDRFLRNNYEGCYFEESCEQLATRIAIQFDAYQVEVSEDGENGGIASYTGPEEVIEEDGPSEEPIEEEERDEIGPIKTKLLPSMKKRHHCFIGIEAEGPNRGSSTLFIPGSTPLDEVKKIIDKYGDSEEIAYVYYGAGWDNMNLKKEVYRYLTSVYIPGGITVEIRDFTRKSYPWLDKTKCTIVAYNVASKRDSEYITYKKDIINGIVVWIGDKEYYKNRLDDKYYNTDKEI